MLEVTAEYIGKALVETLTGLSALKVTICPTRREPMEMYIDGLEEEGIKKISFKLGYDEFTIRIERIDGKITLIERENDGKSLNVESGFFFDEKGQKSCRHNEYSAEQFPSVFGREKEKKITGEKREKLRKTLSH